MTGKSKALNKQQQNKARKLSFPPIIASVESAFEFWV
jgi:hypothetical protein